MEDVRVYLTVSGDTWDLISYKVYGNEFYCSNLIKDNLDLIDIAVFDSNIPIIIPELKANDIIKDYSMLPPWKRD
ncbi:tail protein X [Streptobacillus moniliformis]|uniref:tail protein X n=1 Tax=Streptobacillus moniliformis TaxID=34105 RepID=UPI0007E48A54|nr:tail protein X [Streptobacillus moniliformis]